MVTVTQTHHQAITTRFLGPTNSRGARIVAKCEARRVTVAWDYTANITTNHAKACHALASRLGWEGDWFGGGTADGYVFVCTQVGK